MLAVVAVALGIVLWIAFAWAVGTFTGHPSFRSLDDEDESVDVR